jgi:hypothetical protein
MSRGHRGRPGWLRAAALALAALSTAATLAACESTQSKSDRIARESGSVNLAEKGETVAKQSRDVNVVRTALLQDENGAAVVVAMRNRTGRPLANVPVTFDIRDRRGRNIYRNDAAGLEPSLIGTALLPGKGTLMWVNDQVQLPEPGRKARARTGGGRKAAKPIPRIVVSRPRLEQDPVSGVAASGTVTNRSKVEQRKLVIYAVAIKAGRPVAAGRAQVNRLKPGKRANYQVFFIGNPQGAKLQVAAPPTRIS